MKGIRRNLLPALVLALVASVGKGLPAGAQGSGPQTATPTPVIIIVLPSPTATSGSIVVKPTNSPTGSSVQPPTSTPTQPVIAIATTSVPTATATPTRPSPTPSSPSGVTPTDTREPTDTPTVVVLPAGGVDIQGDDHQPSSDSPAPQPPADRNWLKFLALLGLGLSGVLGVGLLALGLLPPRRGASTGRRTYQPIVFRKRIDKSTSADSGLDQPYILGGMWNDADGGDHSGWIELQGVDLGGSAGASSKLMQFCAAGTHPPAPDSGRIYFRYDSLGRQTATSAQKIESAFEFLHERAGDPTGMWRISDYNPELPEGPGDSNSAGVEVRGWDVMRKPSVKNAGDRPGQLNFRVEIEEVGGADGDQGMNHEAFNSEGNPVRAQSSHHSAGANMLMGDGSVHDPGSDVLVSANGDMLALKEGLAGHSGMSAEQVDHLYRAIGEQIKSSLPSGLRWAQVLWRLMPV